MQGVKIVATPAASAKIKLIILITGRRLNCCANVFVEQERPLRQAFHVHVTWMRIIPSEIMCGVTMPVSFRTRFDVTPIATGMEFEFVFSHVDWPYDRKRTGSDGSSNCLMA